MGLEGSVGVPVHADQLGRNPLVDLGLVGRVRKDHQPRVGVHVDESGAHHLAGGVQHPGCIYSGDVPPEHPHPVSLHPHGAIKAGVPASVDNQAARNQQVP